MPPLFLRTIPLLLLFPHMAAAQEDSVRARYALGETTIRVFGLPSRSGAASAAVVTLDSSALSRFGEGSIVAAVNSLPGVRLEERSPGSLRLAVRGSALRAPFGVRNVKVYYNDISFTDPSGQTFLNALGYYNINGMAVAKGPAGSAYGAGNGGVLLIESTEAAAAPGLRLRLNGGSYGALQGLAELRAGGGSGQSRMVVRYQHREYGGYREQSALQQDVASLDGRIVDNAATMLSAHVLWSKLYYETPGALTRSEFDADPTKARPGTGAAPGAVAARAAVYQDYGLAGLRWKQAIARDWSATTTAYVAAMRFRNPTIRNYSRSNDAHAGGRAEFVFERDLSAVHLQWMTGLEYQSGISAVRTYDNRGGDPDTLRADDENRSQTGFAFTQLTLSRRRWTLQAGASYNRAGVQLLRLNNLPVREYNREFRNGIAPRLVLQYRWPQYFTVYGIYSGGFSPPTTGELSPTGSAINTALEAERGTNLELGLRSAFSERLSVELNVFHFSLRNSIVLRRNAAGGDDYVNAGSTVQRGAEAAIRYAIFRGPRWPVAFWSSLALYDFRYEDFVQGSSDYSGKRLPGVPPQTLSGGIDAGSAAGWYAHLTASYTASSPLQDAGTSESPAAVLVGARLGYRALWKRVAIELYAGGENLLDTKYSLGPDINAFGGRYYNASPGRTFFAGLGFDWLKRH